MRVFLMVCLVAGCTSTGIEPAADASIDTVEQPPPGYQGICVQATTDCRLVEKSGELHLTSFVCGDAQPDPSGFVCFTPRNWFDMRCCLATH